VPVEGEIDIVGAGDSVMAGVVSALASGAEPEEAALVGNSRLHRHPADRHYRHGQPGAGAGTVQLFMEDYLEADGNLTGYRFGVILSNE
jgi:hypothetical protein